MLGLRDLHVPTDKKMLTHMLGRLSDVAAAKRRRWPERRSG